jgi:hypothetical protein
MIDYQFEFVVGCPGSSWSQITHSIRQHFDKSYDMSDMRNHRRHAVPDEFYKKYTNYDPQTLSMQQKTTHFGSYFGPSNEYGEKFDCISENYSRDEFVKECLRPFSLYSKPLKQIRSHWFAYNLDWLWDNFKGQHLFLIWKDPDQSYQHWIDVGGWEIEYPKYDWYRRLENMRDQIQKETDAVLEFADRKNLQFINYNDDWVSTCYPEFNKPYTPPSLFRDDPASHPKLIRTIIQ